MTPPAAPSWPLDELCARVALALAVDYAGQHSGRVRDVPDQRTIRYYTTLGLLDRPAEMRGRTALYGRRHLLQLVAIKRLQSKGLPLAEVQQRLLGLSDKALEQLARLPEDGPRAAEKAERKRSKIDRPQAAFWTSVPAPVMPAAPQEVEVRLAPGVALSLTATRELDDYD